MLPFPSDMTVQQLGQPFPDHCAPTESNMMLKVVIVALAFLVSLQQASGQEININFNVGSEKSDKSQYAAFAELLGQGGGLTIDTAQLETLDITGLHQEMLNAVLLGQIKEMQEQNMEIKKQLQNLTLDICLTKKTCCNTNRTLTCPSGYERFCERPDMCYKFSTDVKNYPDARSACHQAAGGHLAMPKDPATNDFLVKLINTKYTSVHKPGVWVGLTDEVTEGTWVWEDGTPLSTGWSNWYPDYPDPQNPLHNCAMWLPHTDKWADAFCSDFVRHYICEVKATESP